MKAYYWYKEEFFITITRIINQENTAGINIMSLIKKRQNKKLIELKDEIKNPTVIVGDFITVLLGTDKTVRGKSTKT